MAASIETQAHAPWAVRICCTGLLFTALQLPAQARAWQDPPATALPEVAAEPAVRVPTPPEAAAASSASAAPSGAPAKSSPADAWETPHYDKGFVLVSAPASFELPFRLMLKHVSQLKYTNTLAVESTFTDHFGNEHEVLRRHDIQLTRDVFYFSGYVFDRKLDFNILLYTSSVTLTATAAGYIGYSFDKAFALRMGFFSLPSLRAMTGTYPFFQGTDRSMATNYMRPGFTQGIWAEGEPLPGLNYIAMLGNSLNTLDITAAHIDTDFAYSATVWYDFNAFGRAWNDYDNHEEPAFRVGTAFTFAREDRLSDLSTASPENNSTYISDGTLLFGTGALAPNATIERANFFLLAVDAGFKLRGLALNVELYQRWLNDFDADAALPLSSLHDWGFEASAGYFVLTSYLEVYARTSLIHGRFATSYEGAGGVNWYPFHTGQAWINLEAVGIERSPFGGTLYVYSAGQTGFLLQSQFLLRI